MSYPTAPRSGEASGVPVCNTESDLVSRSALLSFLARERSTVHNLQSVAGLFADHPERSKRERWEVTAGKLMLCDSLESAVAAMPSAENLMGKKPFLNLLQHNLKREKSLRKHFAARSCDPLDPNPERAESDYLRADGAVSAIHQLILSVGDFDDLLPVSLSGSAEEQPEPVRTNRQPMGTTPVTVVGSSLPDSQPSDYWPEWVKGLSDQDLLVLSESALEQIDLRNAASFWRAL